MQTLGTSTPRTAKKVESWSLNEGFPAKSVFPAFTILKLDAATGEVEPVAAVGDVPFGIASIGALAIGDIVTVQTEFNAIVRGRASGVVVMGNSLASEALDTDLMKYKVAIATNYVTGIALSDAADTEDVWVGVLRSFRIVPV